MTLFPEHSQASIVTTFMCIKGLECGQCSIRKITQNILIFLFNPSSLPLTVPDLIDMLIVRMDTGLVSSQADPLLKAL